MSALWVVRLSISRSIGGGCDERNEQHPHPVELLDVWVHIDGDNDTDVPSEKGESQRLGTPYSPDKAGKNPQTPGGQKNES